MKVSKKVIRVFLLILGLVFGLLLSNKTPEPQPQVTVIPSSAPSKAVSAVPTQSISNVLPAESEIGIVSRVVDGDTIELSDGRVVRYIGIDTPETVHPQKAVQCFGQEAKEANTLLVLGKSVQLVKDISETDRYGRLLRYVYVDGVFINEVLVQNGFARAYTYPPDIAQSVHFLDIDRVARMENKGLWGSCMAGMPTPTVSSPNSTCLIKGNISSAKEKIYHLKNCPYYEKTVIDETKGEQLFCTEKEAIDAGFRKAGNCP